MTHKEFVRVPKGHPKHAQRHYINSKTGQTISHRAYQEMSKGGLKNEEIAKIRKVAKVDRASAKSKEGTSRSSYQTFVNSYRVKRAKALGVKFKSIRVRGQSQEALEFKKLWAEFKKVTSRKGWDATPEGRAAEILKELDMREAEFTKIVGES